MLLIDTPIKVKHAPTINFTIYMAGDIEQAKHVCRQYCYKIGLCVTVEPIVYIYTGGEESGFRVGLINYPRFPESAENIAETARNLANELMLRLCQQSYSIVGPEKTEWFSRRPHDGETHASERERRE